MVKLHSFYLKTCCEVRLKQLISHRVCVSYKFWQLGRRTDGVGGEGLISFWKKTIPLNSFVKQSSMWPSGRDDRIRSGPFLRKRCTGFVCPEPSPAKRKHARKFKANKPCLTVAGLSPNCWGRDLFQPPRRISQSSMGLVLFPSWLNLDILAQFGSVWTGWVSKSNQGAWLDWTGQQWCRVGITSCSCSKAEEKQAAFGPWFSGSQRVMFFLPLIDWHPERQGRGSE